MRLRVTGDHEPRPDDRAVPGQVRHHSVAPTVGPQAGRDQPGGHAYQRRHRHRRPAAGGRQEHHDRGDARQCSDREGGGQRQPQPGQGGQPGPERGRQQPEVGGWPEVGRWPAAVACGATHTVTAALISANLRSPTPLTSRSWSMLANRPCCWRQATIRCASTGPTPGRVSSCCSVALFRLTLPPLAPPLDPPLAPPDWPPAPAVAPVGAAAGGSAPTSTCSPSVSRRARFTPAVLSPGSAPPAAATASATREPAGSVTTPGWFTLPATSTVTSPPGLGAAAGEPPVAASGAAPGRVGALRAGSRRTDGTVTALGRDRHTSNPAPSTATSATTRSTATPRRPGLSRALCNPTGNRSSAAPVKTRMTRRREGAAPAAAGTSAGSSPGGGGTQPPSTGGGTQPPSTGGGTQPPASNAAVSAPPASSGKRLPATGLESRETRAVAAATVSGDAGRVGRRIATPQTVGLS